MKKHTIIVLILVLAILLCACSFGNGEITSTESEEIIPTLNKEIAAEPSVKETIAETTILTETNIAKAIEEILTNFTTVYLSGDHDAMESYMVDNYQHEEVPYPYDGATTVLAPINGLDSFAERLAETGMCVTSVPFKKSANDDYYIYLTIELVQVDNELKVQFYGLEG